MEFILNNWPLLLQAAAYVIAGLTVATMGVALGTKHKTSDDKLARWMVRFYNKISPLVNAAPKIELPEALKEPVEEPDA